MCNSEMSNQLIADAQGISVRYLNKLFEEHSDSVHDLLLERDCSGVLAFYKIKRIRGTVLK
jgi:hypothetical protein